MLLKKYSSFLNLNNTFLNKEINPEKILKKTWNLFTQDYVQLPPYNSAYKSPFDTSVQDATIAASVAYGPDELIMISGGTEVAAESVTQAVIILIIGVAIIISNIIILATFITMPGPKDVIVYYFMSLGVADLVGGVFVVPLSVYPALVRRWVYGEAICDMAGYLKVTLWFAQLCTFMWISVDRYLAIRKPLRYDTVQTKTRCQCWVVFSWLTSMMLCTPPLLGFTTSSQWDSEAFVCWLDWGNMIAYAFTLIPLVLGPTLATITYTYFYIFNTMRRLKQCSILEEKEFMTALASNLANPDHALSFMLVITFWFSWGPCVGLRIYEYLTGTYIDIRFLHFAFFWLGAFNSILKFILYCAMSPKFRNGLKIFCLSLCCQRKFNYNDDEYY